MLQTREGQTVPAVTFKIRQGDQWITKTSEDIFKGKNVVVFALPGAFTPTCSSSHLPRYNELAPVFKHHGVDSIVCLSVNDSFVMNAWAADQNAEHIEFMPDGTGEFTEAMGMLLDKSAIGFGKRSWRYSMWVRDGVIAKMFIEEDLPGDPFKVSDADTLLNYVAPNAEKPKRITLFAKPGCPHCARAKKALTEAGYKYEEIVLGRQGVSFSSLAAVTGRGTTPQVFVDGNLVGTADELEQWIKINPNPFQTK
jgi:glutaredoxin-like protein